MMLFMLIFSVLLSCSAAALSFSECIEATRACGRNQTQVTAGAPPRYDTCPSDHKAYCVDWCGAKQPYKACMDALRADCSAISSLRSTYASLDTTCMSLSTRCADCCDVGSTAEPIEQPLTCRDRSSFCSDAAERLGTTVLCGACPKFSVIVQCRNADPTCVDERGWSYVTAVTERACASLADMCGSDCCQKSVSVPSQCEGEPNLHFGAGDTPTSAASDSGASTAAQTTAATGGRNSPATSAVATTMSTKHDSPQAESSATPIAQFTFVTLMAVIISRMF